MVGCETLDLHGVAIFDASPFSLPQQNVVQLSEPPSGISPTILVPLGPFGAYKRCQAVVRLSELRVDRDEVVPHEEVGETFGIVIRQASRER